MNFPGGRQGMAVFAIGIIILGLFFYKKKSPESVTANVEAPKGKSELRGEARDTQVLIQSSEPSQSSAQVATARKQANRRMEIGLQPIPTINLGNKLKFGVRAKTFPFGCDSGDFDIIKEINSSFKTKDFLLSVEPIRGNPADGFHARLSLFDIGDGRRIDVTLPKPGHKPRDYGVYLCLDEKKTNNCSKKANFAPHLWAGAANPKADNNRTIYFQMITVSDDTAFIIPSRNINKKTIKNLKKVMGPIMESEDSLDILGKNFSELTNIPGRVTTGTFDFPLPYRHPNCN
jgi:hypothetical protein